MLDLFGSQSRLQQSHQVPGFDVLVQSLDSRVVVVGETVSIGAKKCREMGEAKAEGAHAELVGEGPAEGFGEELADPVSIVGGRRVVLVYGEVLSFGVAAEAVGHQTGGMQEVAHAMLHGQLQRMVGALHIDPEHLVQGGDVVGDGRQVDDGLGPLHGIGEIFAVQDAAGDVADLVQPGRGRGPVEGRDLVTVGQAVQQEIAAHSSAGAGQQYAHGSGSLKAAPLWVDVSPGLRATV